MGGVNSDHWLTQLAPAHAPPLSGWWPLAPGWLGLAILLVIASVVVLFFWLRPQTRLYRAALKELQQFETQSIDNTVLAKNLEHLMRRYAIARFGRETVAQLSGEAWIRFVVTQGGKELAGDTGLALLRAAYGSKIDADRSKWISGARNFLRKSRP